jgi:hypothetical protein
MSSAPSFEKFDYVLRPSKQVERKLIVEAMYRLAGIGFDLSRYVYLGLGSPYYADFIMFHRYLYIDEMICVEDEDIPRRMKFNRPYPFVQLEMGKLSDYLPRLKRSRKYLAWLDYDYVLNEDVVQDISLLLSVVPPDSIVAVTVKAHPRGVSEAEPTSAEGKEKLRQHAEYYQRVLGRYLSERVTTSQLTKKNLPGLFVEAMRRQFVEEAGKRKDVDVEFLQMFNYRYADGAQMLTFGGVLATPDRARAIAQANVLSADCICTEGDPIQISVPPLTRREKLWLDQHLEVTSVDGVAFEIEQAKLDSYRRFARHYPTYHESFL